MRPGHVVLGIVAATLWASAGAAQTTGTPSFNAPYRAFARHEFGGTISFPSGIPDLGIEGQYRFGYQRFDLGFRAGVVTQTGGGNKIILGAEGRTRVVTHTEEFPLDGALILGLGGNFNGTSKGIIMGGLSLGRRVDPRDTQVSIVPYAEPALFIVSGGGTDLQFALGLGADFRLSKVFDVRASVGLGDVEGIAFSAVWVH
ncbi:MAG: hypothetical protein HY700_04115 [Gemmatimonadetes bacterium]|nr:hypothetical protein [Gemmatimonadota bacterium]